MKGIGKSRKNMISVLQTFPIKFILKTKVTNDSDESIWLGQGPPLFNFLKFSDVKMRKCHKEYLDWDI